MSAIAIPRGETIHVTTNAGAHDVSMVLAPCAHQMLGYYCESHQQQLANVGNLVMHLEAEGDHRIAVRCGHERCRVYREVDAGQLAALDPHPVPPPEEPRGLSFP